MLKPTSIKKSFFFVTLVIVSFFLFSACRGKDKDSVISEETKSGSGVTKVAAFILSSDPVTKLFEQGAKLVNLNNLFELTFYNSTDGSSTNSTTLKSLIEKEKSPLVLSWTVDQITPIAPYLTSSNAVGIVAAEVTKKVIPLGANIYGFGYSNELTFKDLAKFAGNKLKSYRFAVISSSEPHLDLQSKVFIEESKSLGNTIVFNEKITLENTNFNLLVERAIKENCDTIFAVLPSSELVTLIKAIRERQFKGKVLVGDALYISELNTLGKEAEGVYFTQAWSDDSNLRSQYLEKYGTSPDGISLGFAALGYDLINCLNGIGTPFDAYNIKNSLLSAPCLGLTGKTQFSGERVAKRRKAILLVKDGLPTFIE